MIQEEEEEEDVKNELTHSLTLHERQHQPTNEPTNHNLLLLRPPPLGCEIVLLVCHLTTIISQAQYTCQLINHATKLQTQVMVLTPFASSNH
jgi:hypothetical protein